MNLPHLNRTGDREYLAGTESSVEKHLKVTTNIRNKFPERESLSSGIRRKNLKRCDEVLTTIIEVFVYPTVVDDI